MIGPTHPALGILTGGQPDLDGAVAVESELVFHHVGVACRDLDREANALRALGYRPEGDDFTDPVQGVRGRFLGGQAPRLELLVPLAGGGVLDPWLMGKIKFYHLAYETPVLDAALARLAAEGAKIVSEPVPSVAFGGRRIAFVMLPSLVMVELIAAH